MADETSLIVEEFENVLLVIFPDDSISYERSIQRIESQLNELVDGLGSRSMVLDFSQVRFFSSRSIGVLLQLRKKMDLSQTQIVLCCVRPELQRIFQLTKLQDLFKFYEDSSAAIAAPEGASTTFNFPTSSSNSPRASLAKAVRSSLFFPVSGLPRYCLNEATAST